MGAERTWRRKHIFFFLAGGAAILLTGNACIFRSVPAQATKTPAEEQQSLAVNAPPQPLPAASLAPDGPEEESIGHLAAARLALAAGDHTTAFIEMEMAACCLPSSVTPEAILLSGLFYADPGNPTSDLTRACETLRRIETEHPESDLAGESRIISELISRLQQAEAENSRLDQEIIDMKSKLAGERSSVQSLKNLLKKMKEIDLGLLPEQ